MRRLPRRDPLSFPEHYTMKWTSRLAVCFTDAPANKIEGIFLHPLLQLAQQKNNEHYRTAPFSAKWLVTRLSDVRTNFRAGMPVAHPASGISEELS